MNNKKIGVLGGGQLGRMLGEAAIPLDLEIHFLDPDPQGPCGKTFKNTCVGSFSNYENVLAFGKDKDVLTIEIEHVNIEALRELKAAGKAVYPDPDVIEIIQDKGLQKQFYKKHNLPTSSFTLVNAATPDNLEAFGYPLVQKLRKGGYDGKGVQVLNEPNENATVLPGPSVLEEKVASEKELAVIVCRSANGEIKTFPTTEMEFNPKANLVEFLFSPADVSSAVEKKAQELAVACAEAFGLVGTLAVELFLLNDGSLLVNECAPRVHNSGHHTIEANYTSQFEQHLRAILGLPLGNTDLKKAGVMVNLLGHADYTGNAFYQGIEKALALGEVYPHIYGKSTTKPYRKMGHATITDNNLENAKQKARKVLETIRIIAR